MCLGGQIGVSCHSGLTLGYPNEIIFDFNNLASISVPSIHASRLTTLMAAVHTLTRGANACVTSLGRGLCGKVYDKHKIKRMDRLLSNENLFQETHAIYTALARKLLNDPNLLLPLTGRPYA